LKKNYSQKRTRNVTFERNKDKSVTFNYDSDIPSSVLLILTFNQLTNANEDIVKKTMKGYRGEILTLHPANQDEGIGFSYSYRTILGNVKAEPNFNFKYMLPFKKGRQVKVRYLNYLGKKFGNSVPKNWKYFQFLTKPNDTVLAIRKGVVVSVTDGIKTDKISEFNFKSKSNSIIIEHEDGTFARYNVLKDKSIMVNVGDIVYPSAPIAVSGSYDLEENSQLRLSIYYLDKKILKYDFSNSKNETLKNKTHLYSYIDPFFSMENNEHIKLEKNLTYTSLFNNSIIEFEMSRREKKKWKKKRVLIKKR